MTSITNRTLVGVVAVLMVWTALCPARVEAQAPAPVVEYYHVDAVGSVRVVTDQSGAVLRRHDYFPFGEGPGVAAGADALRFSGKERDAETGLDYFGARYYAQRTGRFTTVDPGHVGGNIFNPQSWNAYAYAGNNPLRFIDPDGRRWFANNGAAIWVDPNQDGTYKPVGAGWVALDPADYNYRMNVAFVNGTLSFIGEDPAGRKMLAPWSSPEQGLEDTTFSLLANLWAAGSALRAGAGAVIASRGATSTEATGLITQASMTVANTGAVASSRTAALEAAERWVGIGARVLQDRTTGHIVGKISADGTRLYRITSLDKARPYINLENRVTGGNVHVRW